MKELIGREHELEVLAQRLADSAVQGGAIVISGAPGIGKTTLAAELLRHAESSQVTVLRTAGSPSESQMPFAGLHLMMGAHLGSGSTAADSRQKALLAAFGLTDTVPAHPSAFLVGLAVLDRIEAMAARNPLLVLVEDAQWLDRETADVLAFVSRRIAGDPVLILVTARPGYGNALLDGIDDVLDLGPLSETEAAALLDQSARDIDPEARTRVLGWAAGNPLALLELPKADDNDSSGLVPATARLRRTFATRSLSLPAPIRTALLIAAIDDRAELAEITAAVGAVHDTAVDASDLAPAVTANLVRINGQHVAFRHALIRAAIFTEATGEERRAAHLALAGVLSEQPVRQAWHLAAASPSPDSELAKQLESIAETAQARGGLSTALAAQRHAITLSPPGLDRTRRQLAGAELAFQLGERHILTQLLTEVTEGDIGPGEAARLEFLSEAFDFRPWTSDTIRGAVERARAAGIAGFTAEALNLLRSIVARANLQGTDEEVLHEVVATLDELDLPADDPSVLLIYAFAAPVDRGALLLARLRRATAAAIAADRELYELGMAAGPVGDNHLQVAAMMSAIDQLRRRGQVATLAPALWALASAQYFTGDWQGGAAAAAESECLASDTTQPLWAAAARLEASVLASATGDTQRAAGLISKTLAETPQFAPAQVARANAMLALAEERHDEAYAHLVRLFSRGDPAYHATLRSWVIVDLAESASAINRQDEAVALLIELFKQLGRTPSPRLHSGLTIARAILTGDDDEERYAVMASETALWPFSWARGQFAYGVWLRRRRRIAESKMPLRAARDQFDRLGAAPWAERARRELRAAGERSPAALARPDDILTAQELQIATLAAEGLSNREIGERLFLSHRTVGSYLYQVFPKLGVSSRQQLATALAKLR
ncbi:helix-turn-helix transcriptional regulator [Streptomyces sp. NPDC094468]|uniref:helix-turn-helix transcriptional regulator n=1 Tax=Streptomyces sp. NPDC094468 TaxID=3366066 RepID=UPI0037FFEA96